MAENNGNGSGEGNIGLLSGPDIRVGFIKQIATGSYKPVVYSAIDGQAVFEGCIILGSVDEMEELTKNVQANPGTDDLEPMGVGITGARFRWPGAKVPFKIDATLPNQDRVTKAIRHWEEKTKLRFHPRVPSDRNFVTFRPGSGCSSMVGMRLGGGEQFITLASDCGFGSTVHEIGHAIGLWHEQSREDRDRFVKIRFENIQPDAVQQFTQRISDGDDLGTYDYGSIMHYPKDAFSKNKKPTIEPVGGQQIGQRSGLSPGDIAAFNKMYP